MQLSILRLMGPNASMISFVASIDMMFSFRARWPVTFPSLCMGSSKAMCGWLQIFLNLGPLDLDYTPNYMAFMKFSIWWRDRFVWLGLHGIQQRKVALLMKTSSVDVRPFQDLLALGWHLYVPFNGTYVISKLDGLATLCLLGRSKKGIGRWWGSSGLPKKL